jgi:putative salt-induced outer membrane protein
MAITRNLARAGATVLAFLPGLAHAALPDGVRALIEAAVATGDARKVKTVIELARQTNPGDAAELDLIHDAFKHEQARIAARKAARKEAEIRNAGLFERWSGEGEIGAVRSTGNSASTGLTAGLKLKRTGIRWRHKLAALADYQRTDGATTREQFLVSYEPNFQINKRLYLYGLTQYERDRFQGFASRISVSGGLGYHLIDRKRMHLSVKAGPAWRETNFVSDGSKSEIAGLAALDFDWTIAENLKIVETASAYVQSGNTSLASTTGLEAKINGNLSARLSYAVEHDTNPPPDAVKTDTLSRFTLIYGF